MGRLSQRKILVTGAASGIGAATARLFVDEGAQVLLSDWNGEALTRIAQELSMPFRPTNVSDAAAVASCVAEAAANLNGLDGLVNAAGITNQARAEDTDLSLWHSILEVNLTGSFLMCREAIPHLRASGVGTIVNIASASGILPSFGGTAYGVAKAGQAMLSKYLAKELAPVVRVNSVCPGAVRTPMTASLGLDTETSGDAAALVKSTYALQRMAAPEEIAYAVLHLTSSESSFTTGINLVVDGGRTFH